MIELIYYTLMAHMLGDYVLQTDFLAKTKGENWWHMIAHCITYTLPFAILISPSWPIGFLFATHMAIDTLKARMKAIDYFEDQALHLFCLLVYVFMEKYK